MEDLIVNNDLLLIEATSCITSGDAVICSLITGPTYLKKIFFEGQKVRLEPLNPLSSVISEIFKKEEVIIRGKLIKIIRSF
jgi:SOS-response transcriptional repressor LexA